MANLYCATCGNEAENCSCNDELRCLVEREDLPEDKK